MQFEILWHSVGCLKPQKPMHAYFPTRRGVIQLGPINISIIGYYPLSSSLLIPPVLNLSWKEKAKVDHGKQPLDAP